VADYFPDAIKVYLLLWREFHKVGSRSNTLLFERDTVENIHYLEWDNFVRNVRLLAYGGFLEFQKVDTDKYYLTLAEDVLEDFPCLDDSTPIKAYGKPLC
jgi:hypothetical protein